MASPEKQENKEPGKETPQDQSLEALFKSFIEEYNRNNEKSSDAGKVSAWLELATKYAEMKEAGKVPQTPENLNEGNVNDILERTKKDDEANIARWKAFAEKHLRNNPDKK